MVNLSHPHPQPMQRLMFPPHALSPVQAHDPHDPPMPLTSKIFIGQAKLSSMLSYLGPCAALVWFCLSRCILCSLTTVRPYLIFVTVSIVGRTNISSYHLISAFPFIICTLDVEGLVCLGMSRLLCLSSFRDTLIYCDA